MNFFGADMLKFSGKLFVVLFPNLKQGMGYKHNASEEKTVT